MIVMLLARCGGKVPLPDGIPEPEHQSYYLGWVDPVAAKNTTENNGVMSISTWHDANGFGNMVGYGFVFINLVLSVSILLGERAPVRVSNYLFLYRNEGSL